MTINAISPSPLSARAPLYALSGAAMDLPEEIFAKGRVEFVRNQIVKAIAQAQPGPTDLRLRTLVTTLVSNFLHSGASVETASHISRPLLKKVGADRYHAGWTVRELDHVFTAVHQSVFNSLHHVVGNSFCGIPMQEFKVRIKQFLNAVFMSLVGSMQAEHRRTQQAQAWSHAAAKGNVNGLENYDGMVRVLVAVREQFPQNLEYDSRYVTRRSDFELVIADHIPVEDLETFVTVQTVVGPSASCSDIADSSTLTWRAARLVRDGLLHDSRLLVPFSDLAGAVLLAGSKVLTSLLVQKHLSVFEGMLPSRRNPLATALLHWLELRIPSNQLARFLGIAPQTFHGRLARLRELFGETLDDPIQRLEIIVALRSALPEWGCSVDTPLP